jgi:CRP-like cAMP-binding protein
MTLDHIVDQILPLPIASKKILCSLFSEHRYRKNEILFRKDQLVSHLYFVKTGIVRAYAPAGDSELTFWFGREGAAVLSMRSYVENKPGYENIELLEDSTLYRAPSDQLQRLFQSDIHAANWGRKLAEKELISTEERLISREFRNAKERYMDLLTSHPDLLQRVALGHIASYLGITQVSLSRVRAEIR